MSCLAEEFLGHLNKNREKVFFYTFGHEITGNECLTLIEEIRVFLQKHSIQTVAISSKNSIYWPIIYIASKISAKDVFIFDPNMPLNSMQKTIQRFSIECIFPELDLSNGFDTSTVAIYENNLGNRILKGDSNDILFTSGTTAESKGVVVSEKAYCHVAYALIKTLKQVDTDLELLSMPFHHSFGLTRLRTLFLVGQTGFISDGLKKFPEIYKFSKAHSFTGLSLVPSAVAIIKSMLRSKARAFVSNVRYLEIGSSSISYDSRRWLKDNFLNAKIIHHYGMTECSRAFIRYRGLEDDFDVDDSWIGEPLDGCDYKIAGGNKEGELLLKGKNLFTGYLQNKLTDAKMYGDWLKTGDICTVQNGNILLLGRIDNQINIGGEKVQAENLELIIESLPSVKGCICIGVDDDILGSTLTAIVEIEKSYSTINNNIFKTQVDEVFKDHPPYYKPRTITFVNNLPVTQNGKKIRDPSTLLESQNE
jgi:long-chain acyl-CoA synthetase